MTDSLLIVGLGNPGREFRETRHNIGFMLLDRLAIKLEAKFTRIQAKALVTDRIYRDRKIVLAKPQSFMNLSGQSVRSLIRFYQIVNENLLIAHDDIDLPLGSIRIRLDGGSAGQKGIKSIIEHLGTDKFTRIRLGIGRPPGQKQAANYVLQTFSDDDMSIVSDMLSRATAAVLVWVSDGPEAAMNQYNLTFQDL